MEQLYTPGEIGKLLKVNYHKVLDLIHLGELQAYKIGGQYRIPLHSIHEYLDKSKYKSFWTKK